MGYLEGIEAVKEFQDSKQSTGDYVKAKWLKVGDGQTVKLVFLQELDKTATNYSEKNGTAKFFLEHQSPTDWTKKAECTADEGQCYGCEQGWNQKANLYVNVLVDDGQNEPYVAILSKGLGKGSIARTLMKIAAEDQTITDIWFSLSREGKTKDDTTYTLLTKKEHDKNVEDYEVYDLTKSVFHVPYERQATFYGVEVQPAQGVSAQPKADESDDLSLTW